MGSDGEALTDELLRGYPAAARALSPLGRAAAFPRGILYQASEAATARINATIGQLTDGAGQPMPLPAVAGGLPGVDPRAAFLYAPVDGPLALRRAWGARERRLAGDPTVATSTPIVTHGLTHSLSLVADLFADPDTDVLVPSPAWENYDLVFQLHARARISRYRLFRDGRFDTSDLERALAEVRTKAVVVLNFPSNPLGWTPSPAEARQLVEVLAAHRGPAVAVTDDAYQGWVYEPTCQVRSLFWDLAAAADPERLFVIKSDAATKELVFFSSRVGFLTHTATDAGAEAALGSKLKYVIRGTVGCASGPAMALVDHALRDPELEPAIEDRRRILAERYTTLKRALAELDPDRFDVRPFNAAFFALVGLRRNTDVDAARRALLADASVGTIAIADEGALRIAYCSIHNDRLPELVQALARV